IAVWFEIYSWQPQIKPYHVNTPEASARILIAAQGRSHKITTLDIISEYYTGKDVYISVIDVAGLSEVDIAAWDYVVLFSAIRMYKLNPDVEAYLQRTADDTRVFLFNTSGGTQMGYGAVDVITSASTNPQAGAETIIGVIDRVVDKH
ncbi:MAG: hypothetical protein LBD20_10050, partial [Spirochaetaceae bacterium]|nr:hypothetical protein [Spirochaetaceae bacterium]